MSELNHTWHCLHFVGSKEGAALIECGAKGAGAKAQSEAQAHTNKTGHTTVTDVRPYSPMNCDSAPEGETMERPEQVRKHRSGSNQKLNSIARGVTG